MAELSYSTVMNVLLSWDKLKQVPDHQDKAGELIFLRVFELEPRARSLFRFTESEDVKVNPMFAQHARSMVDIIDCAVSFLGPDLDPLKEDLQDLGRRHIAYGVETEYLPIMERAVMYAMEELLDNQLTKEDRQSWQVVFSFMMTHMIKGMK